MTDVFFKLFKKKCMYSSKNLMNKIDNDVVKKFKIFIKMF